MSLCSSKGKKEYLPLLSSTPLSGRCFGAKKGARTVLARRRDWKQSTARVREEQGEKRGTDDAGTPFSSSNCAFDAPFASDLWSELEKVQGEAV